LQSQFSTDPNWDILKIKFKLSDAQMQKLAGPFSKLAELLKAIQGQ
jgi:hypothetical protein